MQTALEPFMQPGVQETKENILLSTLLSLLASARGKGERGWRERERERQREGGGEKKKKNLWRKKKKSLQGQMS